MRVFLKPFDHLGKSVLMRSEGKAGGQVSVSRSELRRHETKCLQLLHSCNVAQAGPGKRAPTPKWLPREEGKCPVL